MRPPFKNITTLFFDGAGTLFHVRGGVGKIYGKFANQFGVNISPELLEERFRRAFKTAPPLAFPRGPSNRLQKEKLWWHDLVAAVFKRNRFEQFDAFFDELFEFFRGPQGWQLYPEVKRVLKELKKRGYRLEVLSNFDSRIYDVCRGLNIDSFLDRYHLSSHIGAAKPNRQIFNYALLQCNIHPWQAVHIGDSLKEDVEGATRAGLQAVWVDRTGMEIKIGLKLKNSKSRADLKKAGGSNSKNSVPSGILRISNLTALLGHFPPKFPLF